MQETALEQFWYLVGGAITLQDDVFQAIQTQPLGTETALLILLLAGFSLAVGQSIVLFLNRVQPIRFIFSLLLSSILYVFSNGFWVISTWLVSLVVFAQNPDLITVFRTLALAYAPFTLGFLVALPYLGLPIFMLLSLWMLLAAVNGICTVLLVNPWAAFCCVALGWGVFQILQRTIGRPAAALRTWIANRTAGVSLVTDIQGIEQLLQAELKRLKR